MLEDIDPLEFLFPPEQYPVGWLVAAVLIVLAVIGWVLGVFVWTMPVEKLRNIPGIRAVTHRVLAYKFTKSLTRVQELHGAGQLPTRQAYHDVSRIFRQFVAFRTGYMVREMTLTDLGNTPLAGPAQQVLRTTYLGQFDVPDPRLVDTAVNAAKEVVATWA